MEAGLERDLLTEFGDAIRRASIGFLSIAQADFLLYVASKPEKFFANFAEESIEYYKKYPELKKVKDEFFAFILQETQKGNFRLIPQLAKGVNTHAQLEIFLQLIAGSKAGCQWAHPILIYPGSFDPMHYGHRLMITSLLNNESDDTVLAVNVNSYQARKKHLEESYERRFAHLEYKLLRSSIVDPCRVCAMDFRFGAKEDEDHLRQTRMQAALAGDARLRWVIGGDKFLSEVSREQAELANGIVGRTLSRFYLDSMVIYVVPRKGQDAALFRSLVRERESKYPASFVLVEEDDYEGNPISSTLIRELSQATEGRLKAEAERMESADLDRIYRER